MLTINPEILRKRRQSLLLGKAELARRGLMSSATISRAERGDGLALNSIRQIVKAFGLSTKEALAAGLLRSMED